MNTPAQLLTAAKAVGLRLRYVVLAIVTFVLLGLVMYNRTFNWFGPILYFILLVFGVFVLAILLRRVLNRKSTDAYIHSGQYDIDFASLPPTHRVWLTQIQFWVYLAIGALIASHVMGADPQPPNVALRPEWQVRLDKVAFGIAQDAKRYKTIEHMRTNGMPWYFVGAIHERESSRNFLRHLHEGSSLQSRTAFVPKGRPLTPNPPYTFEQSAEDALYILKHEQGVQWSSTTKALFAIESYNGLGYRNYHPDVPSPYLWSGTTRYSRGKYVADGKFSRLALDQQVGVVAIWERMKERNLL